MSVNDLKTVRAVCPHDCPDTCGLVVTVRDGKAVDLRGDKEHPFTQGFLCQKVARYLERVYHPDRLQYPMKRVGPKGKGRFKRISWEEALDTIAGRFADIAASPDGPQAILPYSYAGTMGKLQGSSLDRRFFHRLGASLLDRTICATAGAAGCDITLGTRAAFDPEAIVHARYLINWGSNTSVTNMHLWALMHRARKAGARIVTIDPFRCKTAERSDWWLPIRPGTDAALALGLMHVLWRDGLQDDDYLNRYCLGADRLRDRALKEYPPGKVAAITGVGVADVERLAHEYAAVKPACIRVNYGLQRHGGGGMAVRTITCLPAVIGAWRHAGGGALLSTSKLYPFNAQKLERPDLIPPGTRTINMVQLAEALNGELAPPPVRALYVYNANPAAVCPDQGRVLKGLRREDLFTVVHEQFPTDTVDYADIVLPATTQLEHTDIHKSYGHLYVVANTPAIAPLGEAKPNIEVFRLLAKRMGFDDPCFDDTDEDVCRQALRSDNARMSGIDWGAVKERGWRRLAVPERFAPFAEGGFPTPSGKCEFHSETAVGLGHDPLPHYIPPRENALAAPALAARYPLAFISPPCRNFLNSSFANLAFALDSEDGEPRLQIHPDDAVARRIAAGDRVRIFNDRGAFTLKAEVTTRARRGVVVAPSVWWKKLSPDGRNANDVTSQATADLGGAATYYDCLVEVAPA